MTNKFEHSRIAVYVVIPTLEGEHPSRTIKCKMVEAVAELEKLSIDLQFREPITIKHFDDNGTLLWTFTSSDEFIPHEGLMADSLLTYITLEDTEGKELRARLEPQPELTH